MNVSKLFAMKALLLGFIAVPALMVPAFGQQEVDPTWFDPAPASKTVMQTAPGKAQPKNVRKANTTATEPTRIRKLVNAQARPDSAQPQTQTQAMLARK